MLQLGASPVSLLNDAYNVVKPAILAQLDGKEPTQGQKLTTVKLNKAAQTKSHP